MNTWRMTKKTALLLAWVASLSAANPHAPLLLKPLKVRGDRAAARLNEVKTEFSDDYLPVTFRATIRARSSEEALERLVPSFESALSRYGLVPLRSEDWSELRGVGSSQVLRGALIFRCATDRDMEQLRTRLLFVNAGQMAKGSIRQIFVAITPVPSTAFRGASGDVWNDEFGLRIFVAGLPDPNQRGSLPFDPSPLMVDLGASLAAAAR